MYCLPVIVFFDERFKFQADVCNGCHNVLMMSMTLSNIAFSNTCSVNNGSMINGTSKCEVVNSLQIVYLCIKS